MFQKLFAASRKKELQKTWGLLVAKISILEEQRVIETRAEERFRLEQIIIQEREKHQQIEQELLQFEAQKYGIGSTLDNNHIVYSGDINQYWQKNSRSKNIIGFIILFIVFFVLSWVIFFMYNNSNVENIENNEVNIMKLANKENLLLIDFALINNDNDKLVYKIREQAPNIGRLLASFPDDDLSIGVKIVKYEYIAYCFMMSASFESNVPELNYYINNGLDAGYKFISIVDLSLLNSDKNRELIKWIIENKVEDQGRHIIAIFYAIKSKKFLNYEYFPVIEEMLTSISSNYREKYPFENNSFLRWYLTEKTRRQQ